MTYLGIIRKTAECGICKKKISTGSEVYFDTTKSEGNHLAHRLCYETLCAARTIQPTKGKTVKTKERLDPPF